MRRTLVPGLMLLLLLSSLAHAQDFRRLSFDALLDANHCDGELEFDACIGFFEYQLGNHAEAVRIWQEEAAIGNSLAQRNLGIMYLIGRAVPQDRQRAVALLGRAADNGDTGAQLAFGALLHTGEGVRQDLLTAAGYYRMAAD